MKTLILGVALGCMTVGGFAGCETAPKSESGKMDLVSDADTALTRARRNDPSLGTLIDKSRAVAVFPNVGKGGFIVGGAYGKGVLYERGVMTGYSDISQASIGAQAGGQSYTEIIVFENEAALNQFKTGKLAFDAQATAVAANAGAGANAKFNHGVAIFTSNEQGLMAEAAVGGQRFSYLAK